MPLLRVVLPYASGILLEDALALSPPLCGVAVAVGFCCWRLRPSGWLAGCGELLLGVGLGALALGLRLHAPVPSTAGEPTVLTVLSAPRHNGVGCSLDVYVHGVSEGRARLAAGLEACRLLPGAIALARVELGPLSPATNPGASSARHYWARRGVRARGRVRGAALPVGDEPRSLQTRFERARRRLGDSIDPPDQPTRAGQLLRVLVTGERAALADSVRESFSRAGTAHLLAVSGLHVGWVFAVGRFGVAWLVRWTPGLALLRRARAISMVAGAGLALCYALLTGPGIPAVRAAAMACAGTLAVLGGRPKASWNALALAALVVIAVEPGSLFDPALQLSFAAVSGIILWSCRGTSAPLVHCTLAASLATAPLVVQLGAPLPVAGLLANLILVPLFGALLVPLALAAAVVGTLAPGFGVPFIQLAQLAAEASIRLVELLESPDLLTAAGDRAWFALGLAGAGFGLRFVTRGHARLGLPLLFGASIALVFGLVASRANEDAPASLLFLDVGHGDAVLVRSGGEAWLVDAGPRLASFDAGRRVVLPALRAEGVRALSALVLTHPDRDHIGGAESVLRGVDVAELWMSQATLLAPATLRLRRQAARLGIPIRLVARGDTWRASGLRIGMLWPPSGSLPRSSNGASLVLRVRAGRHCAMLPGDVPAQVERKLAPELTRCEILKLSHHGSATSTALVWLRALAPRIAIASAGRRSRSSLPHPDVRRRVREIGARLWETSRHGAIRIELSNPQAQVHPFLPLPLQR